MLSKRGPRPIDDLGAALDSDLAAAPWQCVRVDLRVLGTEPRAFTCYDHLLLLMHNRIVYESWYFPPVSV